METTKVVLSEKFTLQTRDFIRGLLIAALTASIVVIQSSVESGSITFNWTEIVQAAIGGGLAYLAKNLLLEPSKVITSIPKTTDAVQVKEDIKQVV